MPRRCVESASAFKPPLSSPTPDGLGVSSLDGNTSPGRRVRTSNDTRGEIGRGAWAPARWPSAGPPVRPGAEKIRFATRGLKCTLCGPAYGSWRSARDLTMARCDHAPWPSVRRHPVTPTPVPPARAYTREVGGRQRPVFGVVGLAWITAGRTVHPARTAEGSRGRRQTPAELYIGVEHVRHRHPQGTRYTRVCGGAERTTSGTRRRNASLLTAPRYGRQYEDGRRQTDRRRSRLQLQERGSPYAGRFAFASRAGKIERPWPNGVVPQVHRG